MKNIIIVSLVICLIFLSGCNRPDTNESSQEKTQPAITPVNNQVENSTANIRVTGVSQEYNDELNIFEDETLGISFQYPAKWGELSGSLFDNRVYNLGVSKGGDEAVSIEGAGCHQSYETESELVIFKGFNKNNFGGSTFAQLCKTYSGLNCREIKPGIGTMLFINHPSGNYEQFLPDTIFMEVFIDLQNSNKINGLAIKYKFTSPEIEATLDMLSKAAYCGAEDENSDCINGLNPWSTVAYDAVISKLARQIKENSLSQPMQQNIDDFNSLVRTIILK